MNFIEFEDPDIPIPNGRCLATLRDKCSVAFVKFIPAQNASEKTILWGAYSVKSHCGYLSELGKELRKRHTVDKWETSQIIHIETLEALLRWEKLPRALLLPGEIVWTRQRMGDLFERLPIVQIADHVGFPPNQLVIKVREVGRWNEIWGMFLENPFLSLEYFSLLLRRE
jgi:hypothetical protein